MFYYYFDKETSKAGAMYEYLLKEFPEFSSINTEHVGLSTGGGKVTVSFITELNEEQLTRLNNFINNYTDPTVYLSLTQTLTDSARTKTTNSQSLQTIHTFILNSRSPDQNDVFNSLKTVMELSCDSTEQFLNLEDTSGSVTIQIYDITRNIIIDEHVVDISQYILNWKNKALNNDFEKQVEFRTFQVEGLRLKTANYDCIWQFRASVSNTNIYLTLNSLQYLYYNVG